MLCKFLLIGINFSLYCIFQNNDINTICYLINNHNCIQYYNIKPVAFPNYIYFINMYLVSIQNKSSLLLLNIYIDIYIRSLVKPYFHFCYIIFKLCLDICFHFYSYTINVTNIQILPINRYIIICIFICKYTIRTGYCTN